MLNTVQDAELLSTLKKLNFITCKPSFYACNVKEGDALNGNDFVETVKDFAKKNGAKCVLVCAKFEADIALIESDEERLEFLQSIGIEKSGIDAITALAFETLNLRTFYTIGPKEAHAWTFPAGAKAPECAGVIHTDFEKGFIKAETIGFQDYIEFEGEAGAREVGKMRMEGKEYVVQQGDIMNFKFNV